MVRNLRNRWILRSGSDKPLHVFLTCLKKRLGFSLLSCFSLKLGKSRLIWISGFDILWANFKTKGIYLIAMDYHQLIENLKEMESEIVECKSGFGLDPFGKTMAAFSTKRGGIIFFRSNWG